MVGRQLEKVRGQDSGSEEPQEDEAAHGGVPYIQVILEALGSCLPQGEEDVTHDGGAAHPRLSDDTEYSIHILPQALHVVLKVFAIFQFYRVDLTGLVALADLLNGGLQGHVEIVHARQLHCLIYALRGQ